MQMAVCCALLLICPDSGMHRLTIMIQEYVSMDDWKGDTHATNLNGMPHLSGVTKLFAIRRTLRSTHPLLLFQWLWIMQCLKKNDHWSLCMVVLTKCLDCHLIS